MNKKHYCIKCNKLKSSNYYNFITKTCSLCDPPPLKENQSFNYAREEFKNSPYRYETWEMYKSRKGLKKPIYQRLKTT